MTPPRNYPMPDWVQRNRRARALARRPHPCGNGTATGLTCGQYPTVLYPAGYRCATCAAAAGLAPVNATHDDPEATP